MRTNSIIFYTDDDIVDQEIFIEIVESIDSSLNIHIQGGGHELLNALQLSAVHPDLLFLDLNMPGINGFETIKKIRQSQNFKDLPIIVLSTSNEALDISKSKYFGANLYIQKPRDYKHFIEIIKEVLSFNWLQNSTMEHDFVFQHTSN